MQIITLPIPDEMINEFSLIINKKQTIIHEGQELLVWLSDIMGLKREHKLYYYVLTLKKILPEDVKYILFHTLHI